MQQISYRVYVSLYSSYSGCPGKSNISKMLGFIFIGKRQFQVRAYFSTGVLSSIHWALQELPESTYPSRGLFGKPTSLSESSIVNHPDTIQISALEVS